MYVVCVLKSNTYCIYKLYVLNRCVFYQRVKDSTELASLQVQIREFGQTPKQLFFKPHQSRYGQKTEVTVLH